MLLDRGAHFLRTSLDILIVQDDMTHDVLFEKIDDESSYGETIMVCFEDSQGSPEEARLSKARWLLGFDATIDHEPLLHLNHLHERREMVIILTEPGLTSPSWSRPCSPDRRSIGECGCSWDHPRGPAPVSLWAPRFLPAHSSMARSEEGIGSAANGMGRHEFTVHTARRYRRSSGIYRPSDSPMVVAAPSQPYSSSISDPCRLREIIPNTKKAVPRRLNTSDRRVMAMMDETTSDCSMKGAPSSIDPTFPIAHKQPFTLIITSGSSCSKPRSRTKLENSLKWPFSWRSLQPSAVRVSSR